MSAMFRSRISSARRKSSSSLPMATRTSGNSGNGPSPSVSTGSVKSSTDPVDLRQLEQRLGHSFADPSLLVQALSHASLGAASNERLEFLGDRVLGLIIAEKLYADYPDIDEGGLAVRLNALVRRDACAKAARSAGIAPHIVMARSESRSGGRQKAAIVAGT